MDPNEKLTGIASMMPQGGAPMGPPPMGGGQPPMPPMGGGQPPMAPPMPEPGMGEMAMEGQPMPEEAGMDIEQDSALIAEAVVGRAQGDVGAAIAVLDNAKALLIASVESGGAEEPIMANMGAPLMRAHPGRTNPRIPRPPMVGQPVGGQPVPNPMSGGRVQQPMMNRMKKGGPLYREGGGSMSDSDVLRQMIMENLQKPAVQEQAMANVVGQMNSPSVKEVINKHYPRDKAMADLMKYRMA